MDHSETHGAPAPGRRGSAVERALDSLWECIRAGDFIHAAGRAIRLQESTDDPAVLARVEAALGLILQRMGRAVESRDRFELAAHLAVDDVDRSAFLADASMSRFLGGDLVGAERAAREAQRLADQAGNSAASCEATNTLAAVAQSRGDIRTALALARQAVALGQSAAPTTGGDPLPLLHLGTALVDLDRFDEADDAFTTGLEQVRRAGSDAQEAWLLGCRAVSRFLSGRWDDARRDAAETMAAAETSGTVATRPMAAGVWAVIEAYRGNDEAARQILERAGGLRLGSSGGLGQENLRLARAALARDPQRQLQALVEAWHLRLSHPYLLSWRSIAALLVRAALDADDRPLAESVTAEAVTGARLAPGVPSATACVLHCEGLLAGDPEILDAAVAAAARAGRPFAHAHACLDAGRGWLAAGERTRAEESLRLAQDGFEALEATVWMQRTAELMTGPTTVPAPRAPHDDAVMGWSRLTRTEREVARMAASGMTSPAIAARMVVSSRTVQSHLAHIYSKLEIHSRGELAERLGAPSNGR